MRLKQLVTFVAGIMSAVVFLAYCGNVRPSSAGGSGSRLKPFQYRSPDGLTVSKPGVFFDSKLEIECEMMEASDGSSRCLPQAQQWPYYTDANCSAPVLVFESTPCAPAAPAYIGLRQTVPQCAAPRSEVFLVGERLPSTTPVFRIGGAGTCIEMGTSETALIHAVGRLVPPSELAELILTHD